MGDFIEDFMEYTEGISSPDIFRLWSAIATVAGSLERRVWVSTSRSVLYPNLFTLLVAPPGIGKSQALSHVNDLWYAAKKFHVAPDNMTKASLVDAIDAAATKRVIPSGLLEYHSLLAASSEFGVLVPAHDTEFLNVLNHIYDCPRNYRENRRTLENNIDIMHPQLNIIAGTQPGFLATLLPEEAWQMGFTSRLIMIYSATPVPVNLFHKQEPRHGLFDALVERLRQNSELMGEIPIDEGAQAALQGWVDEGLTPIPQHSKLQSYLPRRIIHVLKLAMVSAAARGGDFVMTSGDVARAKGWLLHAEKLMPDVFRDMAQKSDSQVIEELHWFLWQTWTKQKTPVHESRAMMFLQQRLPAEKVFRVLELAIKSGQIQEHSIATGRGFVPVPKHEFGVE